MLADTHLDLVLRLLLLAVRCGAAEWVCWPCKLYEEQQLAAGLSQSEVRPARWELEARGMTIADLPGGSRSTVCGLCPVRQGAFKRTTDARMWCHVVSWGA